MVPALIGASALAGCSTSPQDVVERPEGSRALVMNQPTRIEDYVVVASNISADSAVISVSVDGPAEMADVAPGEQATVNGFTFSLIEINVDPDGEDAPPGGDRTTVWILPTG